MENNRLSVLCKTRLLSKHLLDKNKINTYLRIYLFTYLRIYLFTYLRIYVFTNK